VLLLSDVMRALEDAGEVTTSIAEHTIQKSDLSFKVNHDVCFVLDAVGKKRKKAWMFL